MKKFLLSTFFLCLLGSYLLHHFFNYSWRLIGFHLVLIVILHVIVFVSNIALSLIPKQGFRKYSMHLLNFLFFSGIVLFYIIIIGSNALWGKAISASLLRTYLATFDQFVGILPIEKWIVYTSVILLFALIILGYRILSPSPTRVHQLSNRYRENATIVKWSGAIAAILILVVFLSFNQLMQWKRNIHFAGEPILEFALGPMWNSESQNFVYDKVRLQNGLRDRDCINAVTAETEKKSDRVVVVILLDALRKDYLPAYGYKRPTTPFLDSMIATGNMLAVKNFFSTSTTTVAGVGGLFSSRDWQNFGYAGLNIMKYLKKKGYYNYAFLTGQHRSWYGLTDIYRSDCDFFYESTSSPTELDLDDLTTLGEIKKHRFKENSFVYIHLLSTHAIGKKAERFRVYTPDKIGFGTSQHDAFVNNYDNGILQADFVISEVFKKLKEDGQLAHSTVYVVADHGELFGEDGRWSHSGSIQQNLLTIPLLIYDQDPGWYRNREAGTIKDVAPSIVERLGYTLPSCWEGVSLHQPVHNFSMRVSSTISCEYPEGLLTKEDSTYRLQIFDEKNQVKKTLTTRGGNDPWTLLLTDKQK